MLEANAIVSFQKMVFTISASSRLKKMIRWRPWYGGSTINGLDWADNCSKIFGNVQTNFLYFHKLERFQSHRPSYGFFHFGGGGMIGGNWDKNSFDFSPVFHKSRNSEEARTMKEEQSCSKLLIMKVHNHNVHHIMVQKWCSRTMLG